MHPLNGMEQMIYSTVEPLNFYEALAPSRKKSSLRPSTSSKSFVKRSPRHVAFLQCVFLRNFKRAHYYAYTSASSIRSQISIKFIIIWWLGAAHNCTKPLLSFSRSSEALRTVLRRAKGFAKTLRLFLNPPEEALAKAKWKCQHVTERFTAGRISMG